MYYIKMQAKLHFRDSTILRLKNNIFLNNTKKGVDNVTLLVYT